MELCWENVLKNSQWTKERQDDNIKTYLRDVNGEDRNLTECDPTDSQLCPKMSFSEPSDYITRQ